MSLTDRIEALLPYMRRYARASTGNTQKGDACVERVLKDMLDQSLDVDFEPARLDRIGIYALLDQELDRQANSASAKARRALLLVAVEGFDERTVRQILKINAEQLTQLLDQAEKAFAETTATSMLIIEDEPMISAQLKRIAESLGHHVVGIAETAQNAIMLSRSHSVDIVLCDIQLADGSLGTDAITAMKLADSVPVVFITAYPERYLATLNEGPSYLITKPFDSDYLKAVIGHALLNV
ncbi:MAG: response regulator, partial [Pseudomonadota bacterium]